MRRGTAGAAVGPDQHQAGSRRRRRARASGSGRRSRDVKLAVSEAVSNSVIHAFRDGAEGTISIRARIERGRLLVVVADDGTGMRPNLDSPGLGFGISLITKLAGDVRFDSSAERAHRLDELRRATVG